MTQAHEINFDGLVGPTHNYAGLAYGNLASERHRATTSNPRQAALQALAKMKMLTDMGVKQAVLPPQERPDVHTLRRLGFTGTDAEVLARVQRDAPRLLAACASASSMWAANAATVAPSADTHDRLLHITPTNLTGNFHRSIEPPTTRRVLRTIFADESRFVVHDSLPAGSETFCDEGAANHTRLAAAYGQPGIELFVYGRQATDGVPSGEVQGFRGFRGRQTLEASRAIARLHQLDLERTIFARQSQAAIDAGVFHNDVIAVGNLNVFLCHEQAYAAQSAVLDDLRRKFRAVCGAELIVIEISEKDISLADAVDSYLFNSQLVSTGDGTMVMIAPEECRQLDGPRKVLEGLISAGTPICSIRYADVRQSMKNGGGPACLRLRIVMTDDQFQHIHQGVVLTDSLYQQLRVWIERCYHVTSCGPTTWPIRNCSKKAAPQLDELTGVLRLGSIYEFQR